MRTPEQVAREIVATYEFHYTTLDDAVFLLGAIAGAIRIAVADETELLRKALSEIAFKRPVGSVPKLVEGQLIASIENIALAALAPFEKANRSRPLVEGEGR